MPRPRGSRNVYPTEDERRVFVQMLKDRARKGDPAAAGWLLLIGEIRERESRNGQA